MDSYSKVQWPELDRAVAITTIGSLNTWAEFLRSYYLSCTLAPHTESGMRVKLYNDSIRTFQDALGLCMQIHKPYVFKKGKWNRRDEPAWHDPNNFMRSCSAIGCSNFQDISAAFSIETKAFDFMPVFRNFYAHRNEQTAKRAINIAHQYSIVPHYHPTQILSSTAYGRPQCLLLDWIDDIVFVVELLCK